MDDAQKGRLAQNEDFFREVNTRISAKAESHGLDGHEYEFFCECSDARCVERVKLTLAEYEHIRAEPTRFVVKANHVVQEIEHVVESVPDHMVVEKHGEAGRIAIELEGESADA
jgi:uncharacterized protein (DUF1499 family)